MPNTRYYVGFITVFLVADPFRLASQGTRFGAPPPELEPLTHMIGVWETTAKCRFSPDAPIFEGKSTESAYWSESHQFVISDKRGLTPEGWINQLQITTWDPIKKRFQIIELTPGGNPSEMAMIIEGNVANVTGTR